MRYLMVAAFAFTSLLFGQLDSNSMEITASRSVNLPDDEVIVDVTVNSGTGGTLDQVVAALAGSGITAANFSDLSSSRDGLDWSFSISAPLSKMKATLASLAEQQQSVSASKSGLTMSFGVAGSRSSGQSQSCSMPDLIADAKAQAQKLASAAGLTAGPILAMSESEPAAIPAGRVGIIQFSGAFAVPNVSQFVPVKTFLLGAVAPAQTCALVVKFQLLRYQ